MNFELSGHTSTPALMLNTPSSVQSNISSTVTDPRLQLAFSLVDLELLHNYQTLTCNTLSALPEMQTFMRIDVPRLGFKHPFVLHCVLALSALHLAHFKKGSRDFYIAQAEQHYSVALRAATALLPNINVDNCPALYMFASFCSWYTMATGPKKGDFLLFSDSGIAEWRVLFKGVRAIIEANEWLLHGSDLAPMFEVAIRQIMTMPSNNSHLQDLRDHIVSTASQDPHLDKYLSTLEDLQKAFPMEGASSGSAASQRAFTWLYRVEDEFVECLQQREPIALVIVGHFCVLLQSLGNFWWIDGWAEHLMAEVMGSLSGEHRMWMRWPIEEIGWIPQ